MPKPILRDEEGGAIRFLHLAFSNPALGAADRGAAALSTAQANELIHKSRRTRLS